MSYSTNTNIRYADGAQLDAFGRMRTSVPFTIFDSQFEYDLKTRHWEVVTTGSPAGSVSHLPNESAAQLATGVTNASSATLQTREYFRYHPGRSQQILITFVMGAAAVGTTKSAGYFDDENGYFLEQTPAAVNFVRRSKATGSVVPETVPQASWNLDKFNGAGPSGKTLNLAMAQILVLDCQWLGAGRIRIGFVVDGVTYFAHQFTHSNLIATVSSTTLNLPVRYKIANDGTGAAVTMKAICQTVITEGGAHEDVGVGLAYGAIASATAGSGTATNTLAMRLKPTYAKVNRGQFFINSVHVVSGANPVLVQLYAGGALAVTGVWTSSGTASITERHETIATYTPGECILAFHVGAAGAGAKTAASKEALDTIPLSNDVGGTAPVPVVLTLTGLGGTSVCYYAVEWAERKG